MLPNLLTTTTAYGIQYNNTPCSSLAIRITNHNSTMPYGLNSHVQVSGSDATTSPNQPKAKYAPALGSSPKTQNSPHLRRQRGTRPRGRAQLSAPIDALKRCGSLAKDPANREIKWYSMGKDDVCCSAASPVGCKNGDEERCMEPSTLTCANPQFFIHEHDSRDDL